MSGKESNRSKLIKLAIAVARAYYGDWSAAIKEGAKNLPKIIAIVIGILVVLIIIILIPVMMVQALFMGNQTDNNRYEEDCSRIVLEALAYEDKWLEVFTVAQTYKLFNGGQANVNGAYKAIVDNRIYEYIAGDKLDSNSESIKELYENNYELAETAFSQYIGYFYCYDEIDEPESYNRIFIQQDNTTGKNSIVAEKDVEVIISPTPAPQDKPVAKETVKPNHSTISLNKKAPKTNSKKVITHTEQWIVYSKNDVIAFKVEQGKIMIKYKRFGIKAYFPIAMEHPYNYSNSFGNKRVKDGEAAVHEGIDIFAERRTPQIAIEDCKVRKIGWNSLGGWRIQLESLDGKRVYYYAHMEEYAPRFNKYMDGKVHTSLNEKVKAGELLGLIGSSGSFVTNALPGADTGTPPHIHIQIWLKSKGWFRSKEILINPYYTLKLLENNLYSEERSWQDEMLERFN